MQRSDDAGYLKTLALSVACGIALLPGYIELFPENFNHWTYGSWRSQLEFARTPADPEPDLLVMGDSRVQAAVIPRLLSPRARSLALAGASPIETYLLLRDYLRMHEPPRSILLSFAAFHLDQPRWFWEHSVKWKAWSLSDYAEVLGRAGRLGDPLPEVGPGRAAWTELALHRLNYPPYYLAELRGAKLVLRRGLVRERYAETAAGAGHLLYGRAEGCSELATEAGRERFQPSPLLDSYLGSFLELAAARGIGVALAVMPVNESSYARIPPSYREAYEAYLARLQAEHPEAVIDPAYGFLPDSLFGDRNHVNEAGARLVTARARELLRRARREPLP